MLLTISTDYRPATDLGFLLHKHPGRLQSFELSFGQAHVFYSQADEDRCTACLLLDVDPVGMVRGKRGDGPPLLDQYVNDRPYSASSLMSVAIAQVFGAALQGKSRDRPALATVAIPLTVTIDVLPVRGGEHFLQEVFEPLGYVVQTCRYPLDEQFPEWGESPYFSVTLEKVAPLSEVLPGELPCHVQLLCLVRPPGVWVVRRKPGSSRFWALTRIGRRIWADM